MTKYSGLKAGTAITSILAGVLFLSKSALAVADLNVEVTDDSRPLEGAKLTVTFPDGATQTFEDEDGDGTFNVTLENPGQYYAAIIPPETVQKDSRSGSSAIKEILEVSRVATEYDQETGQVIEFTETVTQLETKGGQQIDEVTETGVSGIERDETGRVIKYDYFDATGDKKTTISGIEYYEEGPVKGKVAAYDYAREPGGTETTISEIEYGDANQITGYKFQDPSSETPTTIADIQYYEFSRVTEEGEITTHAPAGFKWAEPSGKRATISEIEYGDANQITGYKFQDPSSETPTTFADIQYNEFGRVIGYDYFTTLEGIEATISSFEYPEGTDDITPHDIWSKSAIEFNKTGFLPQLFSLNVPAEGQLDVTYDWALDPTPKVYLNGVNTALLEAAQPIEVGPKNEVGTESAGSKLAKGIGKSVVGSLFGGGGSGSSSSSSGPKTQKDPARKQDELLISDPAGDISCEVRTLWTDDGLLFSTGIEDHPDKGTFQAVYLLDEYGNQLPASKIEIYKIWAEHTLTVSWTKSTYQDGNLISQESGGWSESWTEDLGTFKRRTGSEGFEGIPPIWALAGFDRAHAGIRRVGTYFQLTPEQFQMARKLFLVVHITMPKMDPVMTTPLIAELTPGENGTVMTSPVNF